MSQRITHDRTSDGPFQQKLGNDRAQRRRGNQQKRQCVHSEYPA